MADYAKLRERADAATADHVLVEIRKDELLVLLDEIATLARLGRVALDEAWEIRAVMTHEDRADCNELHQRLKRLGHPPRPRKVSFP